MNKAKGFTLIELLIVIAILAVLATVTLLAINPGELLAQGRDSTRISDMNTLSSALSLYLTDQSGSYSVPNTTSTNGTAGCQAGSGNAATGYGGVASGTAGTYPGYSRTNPTAGTFKTKANQAGTLTGCSYNATSGTGVTKRGIDGLGWLPLDLSAISSGSPFGQLPTDPTNSGNLVYRANFGDCRACTTPGASTSSKLFYEIDAIMESSKYTDPNNSTNVAANDGGDNSTCTKGSILATCAYEVGNTDNNTL